MTVQDEVQRLLAPIVATLDVELCDVELNGGTLRVVVDEAHPTTGDDGLVRGITTDRLAQVNRLISPILDQHDPIPGRYTLEVSSPGLERPLRRVSQYQRAVGEEIVVKLFPGEGPRRFRGRLAAVTPTQPAGDPGGDAVDAVITLEAAEIDGVELLEPERHELALGRIASARTVFVWGPGPKPGQPGSRPGGKGKAPANARAKAAATGAKAPKASSSAAAPDSESDHDPSTSSEVCDEQ